MEDKNVCCPKFDPSTWDKKDVIWKDKLFLKDSTPQIFHMPFPFLYGNKITDMWNIVKDNQAETDLKDFLMLAYDPSPWKSELFISVSKEFEGVVKLSGRFLTRVYDGQYNEVPKWIEDMDKYVQDKGFEVLKYYFYYTTCPKCAKKYGHNYCVTFAQVE